MDATLSDAIVAYLAKGRSPFPKSDADAVAPEAPPAQREALIAAAQAIIEECLAVDVDWNSHSLSEGGRRAQAVIAERHPELTPEALEALYWAFTYNWR
ncbi:hypothetical protein [Microbacterium dauci]|uniref:Uncharacterized protein n=1 Tax=Microbacterium dauci TaxID=3048008 RepID=A0ABT6ZHC0_9MICO|nr:hypothetical protein [Microbacterium sp. LX3-4]MDJ1115534.1 hypothetical protein [Microbacterium sp. LX3-4]